jgi:hypothetical protein
MRIERLTYAPKGGKRRAAASLLLETGLGVAGDRRSAKDGSVSLLSGEAEEEITRLGGLCAARYMANLVTRGLDYTALTEGYMLAIGEAELEITRIGKPCFKECSLVRSGERCPLAKNCAFARVLRGGEIRTGDEIKRTGI